MSRRLSSGLISNGLSAATVVLHIAGAATDAVPIAKQILNSAAHISGFAEKLQSKREAMYMLVQKAEIYSTQVDIAVAGRVLDARLQHRLSRLLSVFMKIEALVEEKAGRKKYPARVWNKFIAKPKRAEELATELDHEMTLFNLLTGIQLSLTTEATARAVAEDALYDGQFRRLRDCDMEKLDVIHKRETDTGVIVWSSARVDGQLMVVRHVESLTTCTESGEVAAAHSRRQSLSEYTKFLKNIETVSSIRGGHRFIAQLYGRHIQGPEAVFRSGTFDLWHYLWYTARAENCDGEEVAVKHLGLAYKILDASAHLADVHGLAWIGTTGVVDENGNPRIGLFDDIIRADSQQLPRILKGIYYNILLWFNCRYSEETGIVEQVHDSSLHVIATEQLRYDNGTDCLPRVWDIIQQEQHHMEYYKCAFPIISGNHSLSQELIARARLYFKTTTKEEDPFLNCVLSFVRRVLAGGCGNVSSEIRISIWRSGVKNYVILVEVDACTHGDSHIHCDHFKVHIPAGRALLSDIARAAGLPNDFELSWDGSDVYIYPQMRPTVSIQGSKEPMDTEGTDKSQGMCDESSASEEETRTTTR